MSSLIIRAYFYLIRTDLYIRSGRFASLKKFTCRFAKLDYDRTHSSSIELISHAVDLACVFYPKPVLCLQRSSTLVTLLRRAGIAADVIVGAQILPPRRHAWVECEGSVVNDKPYMRELYRELDRF